VIARHPRPAICPDPRTRARDRLAQPIGHQLAAAAIGSPAIGPAAIGSPSRSAINWLRLRSARPPSARPRWAAQPTGHQLAAPAIGSVVIGWAGRPAISWPRPLSARL
jgi:hypothetical protein